MKAIVVPVLLMIAAAPVFRAGQDRRPEKTAARAGGTASFDVKAFGAGTYLSTSIRLQSHVGLFPDHGESRLPTA